ncbi:MAG TPA: SLC13 family permease [Spirochaetota bacterium]|nr:SLC13 family permease [Spirochaetota bacterium]
MNISIIVLIIVFSLIAIRKIGKYKLPIWLVMLLGSLAVIITGQISLVDSFKSINFDVIFFLFGMFIVGKALFESGYLYSISYKIFNKAKSVDNLILLLLFTMGFFSSLLMNDTIAIIGTPLVLYFAKSHKVSSKMLLLTLCFSITIGSVMTPIGNPQNLLIAIDGGLTNPFFDFIKFLFIPTVINIFITYLLLKLFFNKEFHKIELTHTYEDIKNPHLAMLSKISLILIIFLIVIKILFVFLKVNFEFRLTYIALIGALPIVIFSKERFHILKKVDWFTLIFFISMFILMQSVWNSNFFQSLLSRTNLNLKSIPVILFLSTTISQFISNVPFVALFIPLLKHIGASTKEMLMLACGSTIAGNLFILGAASNIIVIQNAEKNGETITFLEFSKIGIPLTIINIFVYYGFQFLIK